MDLNRRSLVGVYDFSFDENKLAALPMPPMTSGGGSSAPTKGGYEQVVTTPALRHTVRHSKLLGTWDVLGPDGSHKSYHHEDEAEAIAAFWSGDPLHAEEYRRRVLVRRGLLKPEDL